MQLRDSNLPCVVYPQGTEKEREWMDRKFKLSTALDIDDLLMECVPYAIRLANEKYQFDPPLTIHEVDHWGKLGTRADVIFEFFDDPEFFRNQPVIAGAREFVQKLSRMTEVFVSTSVYPKFMGIRAQRIAEEFPEIPPDHIYMGSRKDKIDVDILFDDGMHNVLRSNAAYPILMRRPWNREATGMLTVNNYEEFLRLVEVIADSYNTKQREYTQSEPGIVVLVGPSGSGKAEVVRHMIDRTDAFERLVSYTTDPSKSVGSSQSYRIVDKDEFLSMMDAGEMFESTTYAGHYFGSRKQDVEEILKRGKHVLTVMDICGAMAMKTHFSNVITVYLKRNRRALLTDIVNMNAEVEEKVTRVMAIESEIKNAEICDYVVNVEDMEDAALQILKGLHFSE